MVTARSAPCRPFAPLLLALAAASALGPSRASAGADFSFQVLDQLVFERQILPAYRHYVQGRDPSRLKALLRDTIARLNARPVAPRFDHGESQLAEVTRALAMLEGETGFDARHLPTLRSTPPAPTRQERLDLMVTGTLFPLLIEVWCLQRADGRVMELDLWSSPLWSHLNASSPWLKEQIDGATPEGERDLKPSTCEATTILAPRWVARLEAELARVPPAATKQAADDLRLLRRMVELVRGDPALRLVLEAC